MLLNVQHGLKFNCACLDTHSNKLFAAFPLSKTINPVPLPDLYFDSFSYPVASIVFGGMAIVSLFLLLFFVQSQILSGKVQARSPTRLVDYHERRASRLQT